MDSDSNDSFDDVLATIAIPDEAKRPKLDEPCTSKAAIATDAASSTSNSSSSSFKPATFAPPKIEAPRNVVSHGSNTILVSTKQRGNPLLPYISKVPWTYADIVPDYLVGATSCVLFLSVQYHNLNPDYINERIKKLGKMFKLRVLLLEIDVKDPHVALKHLTRVCLLCDLTLMLAWNASEAAAIIENYKLIEHKEPTMVMERPEQDLHQRLVSALATIKPVNKTDAFTLLNIYGSLAEIARSSEEKLADIPGLGPRKAKAIYKAFHDPFFKK